MSSQDTDDSPVAEAPKRHSWPRRVLGTGLTVLFVMIIAAVGLVAGSFLRFSTDVIGLKPPSDIGPMDGIVVLTGGSQRIDQAVRLLDEGIADRLLISGVNPATTGSQIQKLTSAEPALFECCVDIGHDAIDTRGNANEAALWVQENGYRNVLVVTSNYHMPRSLLELQRVDEDTRFIAYPVVAHNYGRFDWLRDRMVLNVLASEYGKFIIARFRHRVGATTPDGLRSSIAGAEADLPKKAQMGQDN
ncbi:MAG: YdcF family protein [Alphaproteobacteria bacterium]|nr:YdcF family protein [Alphaproteobacteria bacterium]